MLDLSVLRKALAPLAKIGKQELTFDAQGTQVTLRPLLPAEEVEVQKYSASVIDEHRVEEEKSDDDNMSRAAALDYFDRFRIEIIAYAIVQIGTLDLRNVATVATGEVLDNGVEVQIPKTTAMRLFIKEQWSRGMLSLAFYKYGELAQLLQLEADNLARKSASDLDVEIERVEKRLVDLKEEREKRAKGDVNITQKQILSILEAEEALERSGQEALEALPIVPPPPPKEPAPPQPRRSVVPPTSPPPGPVVPEEVQNKFRSSFDDSDDAILEEEQRILAQRRASLMSSTITDPLSKAQPAGNVGGQEAFKLPPQVLSNRGKANNANAKPAKIEVNPIPRGSDNPNFRPSR